MIYLLNVILYFVNYLLVNGGYVEVLFTIPSFDSITPRGLIILTCLISALWIYWIYSLYLLNEKLNMGNEDILSNLLHSAKKLNELTFLLKQFEIIQIFKFRLLWLGAACVYLYINDSKQLFVFVLFLFLLDLMILFQHEKD